MLRSHTGSTITNSPILVSTNGTFVNGTRVTNPVIVELGDEVRFGDASFALGKPLGLSASSPSGPKRTLIRRGLLEALVLAFAVGFGAAQYLAYLFYHEHNRLILAEAVPVAVAPPANPAAPRPVSNPPTARSTASETVFHARHPATPIAIAHAVAPKKPKLKAVPAKVMEIPKLDAAAAVGRQRTRWRHCSGPADCQQWNGRGAAGPRLVSAGLGRNRSVP